MGFSAAVRRCFSAYVTFSGRATRPEVWYFVLFCLIGGILFTILDLALFGTTVIRPGGIASATDFAPFSTIFGLVTFLPGVSAGVRRLHDTNRSGWWWWIWVIPFVGLIVLIVFYATEGTRGANRFGPDPKGRSRGGSTVPHVGS
ncbi:DUF805 domain-containing protein [Pseudoroseicyclus sp. CXY001]|uniref:DUF805 domain-containing protein n=1 Tax=Pseudoroseicyclus sp. CXY001 TaxID=3242492 RepID=UPI0035712C66